jgi:hypothetical protein
MDLSAYQCSPQIASSVLGSSRSFASGTWVGRQAGLRHGRHLHLLERQRYVQIDHVQVPARVRWRNGGGGVRVRSGLLAESPLPTIPATAWLARHRSSLATGLTSPLRFVSLCAHGSLSADSSSSPPSSCPTRRPGYPCHRRTPPRCGAPRLTSRLLPSHPGAALHLC